MNVGVLGLGRMGLPMAQHLIRTGHQVVGFDPRAEASAASRAIGVELCASPAEVGARSGITFVVAGFDDEVEEACAGQDGLLSGAAAGAMAIVCSTVRPETMVRIGALARPLGVDVLDAPLCRAEHAAITGELLVLAGGDRSVFDRAVPVMSAFASDVWYLGGLGSGQVGKMINNYLLWATVVANFEGLRLGQAMGLDLLTLREALSQSSGDNWALRTWHKGRPMPWAEKDMTIFLATAAGASLDVPLADAVRDTISSLRASKERWRETDGIGRGDEDSMLSFMQATPPITARER